MKRINLPKSKKAKLRRVFGVSHVTVWSALNYLTDSQLAKKIRDAALADGGVVENSVVVPEGFIPNCRTEFVRGDDGRVWRIVQTFSNGVRVEFDNDACEAVILRSEKPVRTHGNVVIGDWGNILFEAQSLSDVFDAKEG